MVKIKNIWNHHLEKIWAQNEQKDVILVVFQKLFTPSTMEQKNNGQRTCNCKASDGASSEPGVQISVESVIFQTQWILQYQHCETLRLIFSSFSEKEW